jgi:hypothetical protein
MNGRACPDSFVALTNVEWTLVTIVEGPKDGDWNLGGCVGLIGSPRP